jgi:histidine triad (HIT) family protein
MTLFSKIIAGQIPSYKIYEDDLTYAFLDIHPHTLGHTLVVPKIEVGDFSDLPENYMLAVFKNAQKLSKAIKKATGSHRVGLVIHGMGVPDHFHLHLIPMHSAGDLNDSNGHTESPEKMVEICEKIVNAL